jgi:hypothetical protein
MQVTRDAEEDLEMNAWKHAEALRTQDFRMVIRPNVDTMYSHAWLDLTGGPVLLSVPDTAGRYYVVQAIDEWSLTFATVGTRTTGDGARSFVFVPSGAEKAGDGGDKGAWPSDAMVIRSPKSYVWLLLRIQSDGPEDLDPIRRLQDQFRLRVLDDQRKSSSGAPAAVASSRLRPEVESSLNAGTPPPGAVARLEAPAFFGWASELWGTPEIPVLAADAELVARIAPLGLRPGASLDWASLSPAQRSALEAAKGLGMRKLAAEAARQGGANDGGWYYLKDNWYRVEDHLVLQQQPTNYALRTALSMEALGFLPLQEATYLDRAPRRVQPSRPRQRQDLQLAAHPARRVQRVAPGVLAE